MLNRVKFFTIATITTLALGTTAAFGTESIDDTSNRDMSELLSLIVGEFNNEIQFGAAAQAALAAKEPGKFSLLYHYRLRIESPALPGHWIFAQINENNAPKAYRQTVLEFYTDDEGLIMSRAWHIKEKGMKEKGMPSSEFLNQLSPDQLVQGLSDDCSTVWRRRGGQFQGLVDYRQCVIQSKYKDEKRQLFAEELVFADGMWAREGAYRMNGELAFGLEENQFYQYERTR